MNSSLISLNLNPIYDIENTSWKPRRILSGIKKWNSDFPLYYGDDLINPIYSNYIKIEKKYNINNRNNLK